MNLLNNIYDLIYAPTLIISISILVYFVIKKITNKMLKIKIGILDIDNRRQKRISRLILNTTKTIIIIIATLSILSVYGIETKTVLASLGVVSVVLGLAFQDILKDFLAGVFILVEGNYTIGDTVEIGGFKGDIIAVGLRTTKLQAYTGEIKIFSNRNINEVTNFSISDSLAVVDLKFSYNDTAKDIEKILEELIKKVNSKFDKVTGDATLLGIQELNDSYVTYRITVPTKPNQHFDVEREILKEIKLVFDKKKAKVPYVQIEVHK